MNGPEEVRMMYAKLGARNYKDHVLMPSIHTLLSPLPPEDRRRVIQAMFVLVLCHDVGCMHLLDDVPSSAFNEIEDILKSSTAQIKEILSKLDIAPPSQN